MLEDAKKETREKLAIDPLRKELAECSEVRDIIIRDPHMVKEDKNNRLALLDYHKIRCEALLQTLGSEAE